MGAELKNNPGLNNENTTLEQQKDTKELFLSEQEKIDKFKNNPDLYNRAKEELNELKKEYESIKNQENGKIKIDEFKKEFNNDIRGIKNIAKIAGKDFIKELGNNNFTDDQEESIYKIFKRTSKIEDFLKFGGQLPKDSADYDRFIEDLDKRKQEKKKFKKFEKNIKTIDFSKVTKVELKEYINDLDKYKKMFDLSKISEEIKQIKTILDLITLEGSSKYKNIKESEKNIKESEKNIKESEKNIKESEKNIKELEKNIKESKEKQERSINNLKSILNDISGIEGLEGITVIIKKIDNINDNTSVKEIKKIIEDISGKIGTKNNLKKIFKIAAKKDKENGIDSKDSKSLYSKLYNKIGSISPRIRENLSSFGIQAPNDLGKTLEGEISESNTNSSDTALISAISGGIENVGSAKKVGEGQYVLDDKEFKIDGNEVTVSKVGEDGFKVEMGSLDKDDLSLMNDINGDIQEGNKRLGNLKKEFNDLKNQLALEENKTPKDENKITELKQKLAEKKGRIDRKVKEIQLLNDDLKKEKKNLSNIITQDKVKKVEKGLKVASITGWGKFFPQSFTNEIEARINLSPSLREKYGFQVPINFSEGVFGFNETGESETTERIKFAKFVNSIISGDENKPLNLIEVSKGNIGYGENELDIQIMISKNLTSGVTGFDITKVFENLDTAKKLKNK